MLGRGASRLVTSAVGLVTVLLVGWVFGALGLTTLEPALAQLAAVHGTGVRVASELAARDIDRERCHDLTTAALDLPDPAGARAFEARRGAILGRAHGSAVSFLRPPRATPPQLLSAAVRGVEQQNRGLAPVTRIGRTLRRLRGKHAALRQLLLREGYLYSDDPLEARWLVRQLTVPALFDEPEVWLQRGATLHRLTRRLLRRRAVYRHAAGPLEGQTAQLFLGDRLATAAAELDEPLHRDWDDLRQEHGFDRARVLHHGPERLVAELRFDGRWLRALLQSRGAALELICLDASAEQRKLATEVSQRDRYRRRSMALLQSSVQRMVSERLPFDRPRGAEDHFSDGQLRSRWNDAYRRGQHSFEHDDESYPVFNGLGRPAPPQMCVEFIIDSFERASGTWYAPRGEARARRRGGLDFNELGIQNRAGVLAFERFAMSKPTLFQASRFLAEERIRFADRGRFFDFLMDNADRFQAGDIVAIQGRKSDGNIHQHAILIEDVDPLTGFPHALADQMHAPRRRSWEGIMAEAPDRSLLYHLRPTPQLLTMLQRDSDVGGGDSHGPTARASSSGRARHRSRAPALR